MAFLWEKKGDLLLQEGPYFTGRSGPLGPHNTRSLGSRGPIPLVDWGLGGPTFGGGAFAHDTGLPVPPEPKRGEEQWNARMIATFPSCDG